MAAVIEIPTESQPKAKDWLNGVPGLRLFTTTEYEQMVDAGVLNEDDRVELIEGRIVQMAPKNMLHATATRRATRCFMKMFSGRAVVSVQDPILLKDFSEPEPDLVLAAPPDEKYLEHHPTPEDIFLVLEIADSSVSYDREKKGPIYAQHGIIQFCLLNLQTRELEDYRDPSAQGYRTKKTYTEAEKFNLVSFPKVSIKVGDLLPPMKNTNKRRKK